MPEGKSVRFFGWFVPLKSDHANFNVARPPVAVRVIEPPVWQVLGEATEVACTLQGVVPTQFMASFLTMILLTIVSQPAASETVRLYVPAGKFVRVAVLPIAETSDQL